jgi:hypothetical protein
MTKYHDPKRPPARVSESAPVQVFLGRPDRELLDRLTHQLGMSKSDVLRRSLAALEQQLLDPLTHPTLRLIGMVDDDGAAEGVDPAIDHDAYLADANDPKPRRQPRRRRGKS